jgi:cobalt-zinc-cadmium efflux system membrane fusion protein
MNNYFSRIGLIICVLFYAVSCQNKNQSTEEVQTEIRTSGDTVMVNEKSPILGHLITQKTSVQDFSAAFSAVGTVRPVSGKLAEIATPFAGRIFKTYVRLGQKVGAGSPVFEFSSSELYDATKAYFVAQSANELAQKAYNRQKELAANGVAAQKDLEQAQSDAMIASQEFEQAKATLSIFNIDLASLKMGQPSKVVSPIAGEVVKSNITIGSYVKEDAGPLVVIADLSRVWVAAQVKEKFSGAIKSGDSVQVISNANPGKIISGTVYYISEMLDEETRAVEVIIDCNNTDKALKLGMFCDVRFSGSPVKAIILPSTAIMKEQDNDYVLIELSKGKYVRRVVESETVSQDKVLVKNGLQEGENVVVQGGIYLNM